MSNILKYSVIIKKHITRQSYNLRTNTRTSITTRNNYVKDLKEGYI